MRGRRLRLRLERRGLGWSDVGVLSRSSSSSGRFRGVLRVRIAWGVGDALGSGRGTRRGGVLDGRVHRGGEDARGVISLKGRRRLRGEILRGERRRDGGLGVLSRPSAASLGLGGKRRVLRGRRIIVQGIRDRFFRTPIVDGIPRGLRLLGEILRRALLLLEESLLILLGE